MYFENTRSSILVKIQSSKFNEKSGSNRIFSNFYLYPIQPFSARVKQPPLDGKEKS